MVAPYFFQSVALLSVPLLVYHTLKIIETREIRLLNDIYSLGGQNENQGKKK